MYSSNPLINFIHIKFIILIILIWINLNFPLIVNILLFFQFLPISLYIKPFIPPSEKFYPLCHNYIQEWACGSTVNEKGICWDFWEKIFPLSVVTATVWQSASHLSDRNVRKHEDQLILYAIPWPKENKFKMKPVCGKEAECQIFKKFAFGNFKPLYQLTLKFTCLWISSFMNLFQFYMTGSQKTSFRLAPGNS